MDLFSYVQSKAKVEKEGSDFYKVEPAPCCEHRQCAKLKDLGSNNWLYKCFSCGFSAKQAATLESKINNITYNEAVSKLKGHNVIKLTDPIAVLVEKNHKTLFNNPTYLNWLVSGRKLDPTVLKKFKVGCFKNKSGKVLYTFPYYKDHQILNIKTRSSDKSIVYQKKNAGFYIYNYNVIANTDSLLIVEGEMDLLAGYSYKLELPIISFGLGANNIKQEWIDELSHIKSIYLMYDMDDAGKQGRVELAKKLGTHRCKIIQLPHKDLNACLMNGVSYDVIIHCIQKSLLLDQLLIIEEIDRVQGEDTVVGGKLEGILNLIAQRPATESEDYLGKIRENIPSITYRQHLDFRRRIDQLRNLAPLTKEDNKKGNSNVMTNEDKSEALNLLKNKKLLETISTYFEELGLVGERENTMICFLSAVSRLMDDTPIHCLVNGQPSSGKSAIINMVASVTPDEDLIMVSSSSSQALNYLEEEDLYNKVIVFSELDGAEDVLYSLRIAQSEGMLNRIYVGKCPDTGKMATHESKKKVKASFLITTNLPVSAIDSQNVSRCMILNSDDGLAQTKNVNRSIMAQQTRAWKKDKSKRNRVKKLLKNCQKLLKPIPVDIPYAQFLKFPAHRSSNRRDLLRFTSIIKVTAFIRQYQKEILKDEVSEYLEADLEDYKLVYHYLNGVLENSISELSSRAKNVFKVCCTLQNYKVRSGQLRTDFTYKEIQRKAQDLRIDLINRDDLRLQIYDLLDLEYLLITEGSIGQRGKKLFFKVGVPFKVDDKTGEVESLIKNSVEITTPDELEEILDHSKVEEVAKSCENDFRNSIPSN